MRVAVTLEVESENVAAALQGVLYAIDCEGGDLEVLEASATKAYESTTEMQTSTVVHNHVTNCEHTPNAVALTEQAKRGRALPANLT